jgi:hypothetical protein
MSYEMPEYPVVLYGVKVVEAVGNDIVTSRAQGYISIEQDTHVNQTSFEDH